MHSLISINYGRVWICTCLLWHIFIIPCTVCFCIWQRKLNFFAELLKKIETCLITLCIFHWGIYFASLSVCQIQSRKFYVGTIKLIYWMRRRQIALFVCINKSWILIYWVNICIIMPCKNKCLIHLYHSSLILTFFLNYNCIFVKDVLLVTGIWMRFHTFIIFTGFQNHPLNHTDKRRKVKYRQVSTLHK